MGCISTEQAVEHQQSHNAYTQQEIDVCLQQDRDHKNNQYKERKHEQQMAYYNAEMLDEIDDITENLAYGVSRPLSPLQSGNYTNNIGDTSCGYWLLVRWILVLA